MGEVFRAEHAFAGRMVAIKLLRPDLASSEDLARRLFFEAQAVNKIRHPNIVDVIDAGVADEGPYIVMEYLHGTSLAVAIEKEGHLDAASAVAIAVPVLNALEAAHVEGIVHRDLKPGNVFLAAGKSGPIVKVLDFGIAKALGASAGHTSTGLVLGTPDYLSPEQATGDSYVDGRSDVFSAGTVLFEMLTGKRPFEAPAAIATAYRIVHADTPTLDGYDVSGASHFDSVLARALAKKREDRYSSAAEMAAALLKVMPNDDVRAASLGALVTRVVGTPSPEAGSSNSVAFAATVAAPARGETPIAAPRAPRGGSSAPTLVSNEYAAARPASTPSLPVRERFASEPQVRSSQSSPSVRERMASDTGRNTPTSSRSRGEPPTPLTARADAPFSARPSAAAGTSHTRGTLPRALYRMVGRSHGEAERERALEVLTEALAESYRNDGFNALFWYELGATDDFLAAVTEKLLHRDANAWRRIAREQFEQELAPMFRPMRFADVETALRRIGAAHARVFDFGTIVIQERKPGLATIRYESFGAASLALRSVLWGTLEGTFAFLAGRPELKVIGGQTAFAKDFELEISWLPS